MAEKRKEKLGSAMEDPNVRAQQGPPADFGGPVYPNPDNVQSQMDTDNPPAEPLTGGGKMDASNAPADGGPQMDVSNPHAAQLVEGQPQDIDPSMLAPMSAKMPSAGGKGPMGSAMGDDQEPIQVPAEAPKPAPVPPPDVHQAIADQHALIMKDKMDAAKNHDLVGMGMATLQGNVLNSTEPMKSLKQQQDQSALGSATGEQGEPSTQGLGSAMPEYVGKDRIGGGTPGEEEAKKQYQDKLADLDNRMRHAAELHTPEGLKELGYLEKEKALFEKQNPWGSKANHPGIGGKIAHVAAGIGNTLGNAFAPEITQNIPGSSASLQKNREQGEADINEASHLNLEGADAAHKTAVAKAALDNNQLYGKLLLKGYAVGHDPTTGEVTLTQVPGFRDAPKNVQEAYAGAVSDALAKNPKADPTQDPAVQSALKAVQAAQKVSQPSSEANNEAYQGTVAKLAKNGLSTEPGDLNNSLTEAKNKKLITDDEYAAAKGFQAGKPNNETKIQVEGITGDAAEKRAIDKMFTGKDVVVQGPNGPEQMSYKDAKDKYSPDEMSAVPAVQSQKNKDAVGNAIDTKNAIVNYYKDFNKYANTLTDDDKEILGTMQRNEAQSAGELSGIVANIPALGPISEAINQRMQSYMNANGYENLSDGGKKMMADYFNAQVANFADMKRRLGSVGRNQAMILTEMHTIPFGNLDRESANDVFTSKIASLDGRNHDLPRINGRHPDDITLDDKKETNIGGVKAKVPNGATVYGPDKTAYTVRNGKLYNAKTGEEYKKK